MRKSVEVENKAVVEPNLGWLVVKQRGERTMTERALTCNGGALLAGVRARKF